MLFDVWSELTSDAFNVRFWCQQYWASRLVTRPLLTLNLQVKELEGQGRFL